MNFKSTVLYTDILPSYLHTYDNRFRLKISSGKVIVGITGSDSIPTLTKGKIVDKDAAKVASAAIANGKITVTAKSETGTVYLWVMDTGDRQAVTCCPITVKVAPTALNLYGTSNIQYGVTKKYENTTLEIFDSTDVYLYPTYVEKKGRGISFFRLLQNR